MKSVLCAVIAIAAVALAQPSRAEDCNSFGNDNFTCNGSLQPPFRMIADTSHPWVAPERALKKHDRWHWYELSDAQQEKLTAVLKAVPDKTGHVLVMCGDADCRPLAQDVVESFEAAGWKVELVKPFDEYPGLHSSDAAMCDLIKGATGIPCAVFEQPALNPTTVKQPLVVFFGEKRRQ